jgi:hypothetical protein
MKKILLLFALFAATVGAQAQRSIVFNELVPDPGNSDHEYFELYNTTSLGVNVDCYTVVAYDFLNDGAWVYNLPNATVSPFGHLLFAAAKPFSYKCGTFDSTNVISWNTATATSKLTYYDRVGNALVNPVDGLTQNLIPIAGGNSASLAIMLFDENGDLINGFFTNNGTTVPVEVTTLAPLSYTLTASLACGGTTINLDFAGITAPEAEVLSVNQAVGNNNNYYRERDGFCGSWMKGSVCNGNPRVGSEFTPGKKNSGLPPVVESDAVITVATQLACGAPNTNWNVTIQITDATLVPGTYRIYADINYSHSLNDGDLLVTSGPIPTTAQISLPGISIMTGRDIIIQVVTASGCIVVTRLTPSSCAPLPVNFKSFTATRQNANVMLRWETSMEQNNSGFAVERNVNGTWVQIAWVASLSQGGNSDAPLSYSYVDFNTTRGVSQYRIRQVDFDSKSKYTEIRSVRGEGQLGNTIVYPNPSNDGKVNIVFEGAAGNRDIAVTDMSGRIVKQLKAITNNNITIDNLQPGMYMVRIVDTETGAQVVEKIVVNKR